MITLSFMLEGTYIRQNIRFIGTYYRHISKYLIAINLFMRLFIPLLKTFDKT